MGKKISLVFAINTMEALGTQKNLATLAKSISGKRFKKKVLLYQKKGRFLELLPKNIEVVEALKPSGFLSKIPKLRAVLFVLLFALRLRREQPDIVFGFTQSTNFSVIIAKKFFGFRGKAVLGENNFVSKDLHTFPFFFRVFFLAFVKSFYNSADLVVAVSKGVKDDLVKNFGIKRNKIKVIWTPIDRKSTQKKSKETVKDAFFDGKTPVIISVARLVEQKGLHYLLNAFAIVRKKNKARLALVGDGNERKKLEALAKKLNISKDVKFLGFQPNPFKFVSKANVFASSSLWEGFQVVLMETMCCGTPIVVSNCKSGPSEIIEQNKSGILVPTGNEKALAKAILKILNNKRLAKRLATNALKRVEKFGIRKITKEYENMLLGTLSKKD